MIRFKVENPPVRMSVEDEKSTKMRAELVDALYGESAYEIALKHGFEGTEEEWLASLHGKDGKDGVDGKNGIDGKDGRDGTDGKDGKDGYTPVKGVDYFDGKDGQNGKDGVDGKDGADGKTPVKGTDYFTEADKAEMVSAVISALPVYGGEIE